MGDFLSKIITKSDDNLETFTLVWLDASVDKNSDNLAAQDELRATINQLQPFSELEKCVVFIETSPKTDRIVLIVSGSLSQEIVPHIHKLEQLLSIYIYCYDVKGHEQWSKSYCKVRANPGQRFISLV